MPYRMEDFQRDAVREQLKRMSPGEILENISVESLLKGVSAEDRLKGMSEEELVQVLELIKRKLSASERDKNINFPRDDVPGE